MLMKPWVSSSVYTARYSTRDGRAAGGEHGKLAGVAARLEDRAGQVDDAVPHGPRRAAGAVLSLARLPAVDRGQRVPGHPGHRGRREGGRRGRGRGRATDAHNGERGDGRAEGKRREPGLDRPGDTAPA